MSYGAGAWLFGCTLGKTLLDRLSEHWVGARGSIGIKSCITSSEEHPSNVSMKQQVEAKRSRAQERTCASGEIVGVVTLDGFYACVELANLVADNVCALRKSRLQTVAS